MRAIPKNGDTSYWGSTSYTLLSIGIATALTDVRELSLVVLTSLVWLRKALRCRIDFPQSGGDCIPRIVIAYDATGV